jgi:isocitrate/isopropylmalate dehydrogenase
VPLRKFLINGTLPTILIMFCVRDIMTTPITIAYGDGDAPEMMEAVLLVLKEAGAELAIETIEVGARIYNQGSSTGVLPSAWENLKRTGILLMAPTMMPQGEGYVPVATAIRHTMGENFALFEAAEPLTLPTMLHAAMQMLEHIGQQEVAEKVKHALPHIIEAGLPARESAEMLIKWLDHQ